MTQPSFEVLPRDLSAYRQGNTGIDCVHRFESGRPGPHVMVNALTHGNEFCGMVAACHLLDTGVRPHIGTLTVSFANVAAYVALDFLAHFGLIEREVPATPRAPQRRFELLQTCMVTHADFRFARPVIGFETFAQGELIATQGSTEIRSPCDGCTILMPTREPIVGPRGGVPVADPGVTHAHLVPMPFRHLSQPHL